MPDYLLFHSRSEGRPLLVAGPHNIGLACFFVSRDILDLLVFHAVNRIQCKIEAVVGRDYRAEFNPFFIRCPHDIKLTGFAVNGRERVLLVFGALSHRKGKGHFSVGIDFLAKLDPLLV